VTTTFLCAIAVTVYAAPTLINKGAVTAVDEAGSAVAFSATGSDSVSFTSNSMWERFKNLLLYTAMLKSLAGTEVGA
jgi:hypothetical protein